MLNFYFSKPNKFKNKKILNDKERFSLHYHDLFDYPLSLAELIKWLPGEEFSFSIPETGFLSKNGYFYKEGKEGLIYKRLLRKRISTKKVNIAKKAAWILSLIPTVRMVAITGSLAMENSSQDGDIDLLIVTKKGWLWTSRIIAYSLLKIFNLDVRTPQNNNQKDRLCLNMWLDESALEWAKNDRNVYTSHEIAQILPLVNKEKTYEFFLSQNAWILKFWPNAVKINTKINKKFNDKKQNKLERLCYGFQLKYMKNKMTREIVRVNKAIFHPQDWGKFVLTHLR